MFDHRCLVVAVLALALGVGCGGGGGSDTPSVASNPPSLLNSCPSLPASTLPAGSIGAIVDGLVATQMQTQGLPGMAVAIGRNGTILYSQGYGYANLASCVRVQPTTEFQIGSVTKQFTAAAILKLQSAGTLNLDNTVVSYLPSYAFDARITVRMLLNHTSGLDDYVNNRAQFPLPPGYANGLSQQTVFTAIVQAPLLFVPGSAFLYSNSNYFVLGSIIEAVTARTYPEYMTTEIFQPNGLNRTTYLQPLSSASPYSYANPQVPGTSGLAAGIILDPSVYFATGALWSNVQDLATWDAALRNGNVISPAQFTVMVTPPAVPVLGQAGTQSNYAMGWGSTTMLARPFIWHDGQTLAYTAVNGLFLDNGLSVAVLTNVDIQGRAGALDVFAAALLQAICTSPATASSC